MAETTTIARPYAVAVFKIAQGQSALAQWSGMLKLAAAVASDKRVRAIAVNPRLKKEQVAKLVLGICGDKLNQAASNFIKLIIDNGRLLVLPEISALYEESRAEAERTVEAQVISAFAIDESQKQQISAALKKRMNREVSLSCVTDPSLMGGAIIRAGDLVIDGSVTGQLAKLSVALAR